MMSWWQMITTSGSVVAAIGIILGAAYSVDLGPVLTRDLAKYDREQKEQFKELRTMAENATRLGMVAQFNILYEKKLKCDCLTFQEQQDLCRLARELAYTGIQGCS